MKQGNALLVKVKGVDKVFRRGSEEINVLGGLDLEVPEGEFLALMGAFESGLRWYASPRVAEDDGEGSIDRTRGPLKSVVSASISCRIAGSLPGAHAT